VRHLEKTLKLRIESLSLTDAMPGRVGLVIDGRIVGGKKGTVVLEARVRDPKEGRALGTVATRSLALTKIDTLANELARKLAPVVEKADKWRKARAKARAKSGPIALPETIVTTDVPRTGSVQTESDSRPVMLIARATGKAAAGTISITDLTTRNAVAMVESLGYRPVVSATLYGIAKPKPVSAALGAANANYALLIDVRGVRFGWHGVLSARGKVRVVVVDRTGKPTYDETVKTGTLVGSRGDRHDALVHFVTIDSAVRTGDHNGDDVAGLY
jgi:hypothetical protein